MSLGFISGLDGISEDMLLKHLITKGINFNKSRALQSIKTFKHRIERDYWELVFQSLKKYSNSGVKMYILGKSKLCTVYIRFAFAIGDDPALHRFCGVYEGNATRSCLRCLYSARQDGLYDERKCMLRQYRELETYTAVAEDYYNRKIKGEKLSTSENIILKKLHRQCIHPMKLGCNGVPMGYLGVNHENNIYNSCPSDILHGFLAGIIRNVILWTMTIIHNVDRLGSARNSRMSKYANVRGALDDRVASFKYWPKMPNMVNAYFRKGCSFINKNKRKNDLLRSTGGVPGLRSMEFISLALQIYLSVSKSNCNYI